MGKKEELKTVGSTPLDSIDDDKSKSKKEDTKTESEAKDKITDSEAIKDDKVIGEKDKTKKDEKDDAPIEDIPLDDDEVEVKETVNETITNATPPPPPTRPKDPVQQITQDLKDAFPSIEEKLITAVLIASQGNPEPAFSALLYISDPSFEPEIPVYQNPSIKNQAPTTNVESVGFTDDEILARKLQKEFELEDERRRRRNQERRRDRGERERDPQASNRQHRQNLNDYERNYYEEEESPDEFDQIKETFTQGLEEAKSTLNGWVSGLAKKFDSATANRQQQEQRENVTTFGSKSHREGGNNFGNLGGTRYYDELYKGKKTRFDEDPEIITTDFHDKIRLSKENDDNEETMPSPHLPTRPRNSTELQSDTPSSIKLNDNTTDTTKRKQPWQPEDPPADSDAFLVDDSEEEDVEVTPATNEVKK
ncbi:CUE5 [Candida pseudojiufengensis]|uniref:CUE5 n=1 Tax=Candida pseudojiufengensis TaxID=497109 RepID=UPI0022246518|nr:CUE5 [Candida pseudojiufengensis]KAI5961183.1 CUE5 [Candida pseudojiufengensis]